MPGTVFLDPTVPQGSESLKTGPSRIKAIAAAVLEIFGFSGAVGQSFPAPFGLDPVTGLVTVIGPPTDPLGIATAQYADRKAVFSIVSSGDGVNYSGTGTPTVTALDTSALYVIQNVGQVNAPGAVFLSLDGLPPVPVNRSNGSALAAGDFLIGMFLLMFDGSNFRIVNFIGGTIPLATTFGSTLTLAADPAADLEAATRQYVDRVVGIPVRSYLGGNIAVPVHTGTAILTVPIIIPNDGHYLLQTEYILYMDKTTPIGGAVGHSLYAWITDGTVAWGAAGNTGMTDGGEYWSVMNAAGVSPVAYAPGVTVNVVLKAIVEEPDWYATPAPHPAPPVTDVQQPNTYLGISLVRSHA